MMRPKYPTTLAAARKAIRAHREREQTLINLRHADAITITGMRAQLNDKEDKLLPAKTEILKQLAFLTNATSRAVRTTMWSLKRPENGRF